MNECYKMNFVATPFLIDEHSISCSRKIEETDVVPHCKIDCIPEMIAFYSKSDLDDLQEDSYTSSSYEGSAMFHSEYSLDTAPVRPTRRFSGNNVDFSGRGQTNCFGSVDTQPRHLRQRSQEESGSRPARIASSRMISRITNMVCDLPPLKPIRRDFR